MGKLRDSFKWFKDEGVDMNKINFKEESKEVDNVVPPAPEKIIESKVKEIIPTKIEVSENETKLMAENKILEEKINQYKEKIPGLVNAIKSVAPKNKVKKEPNLLDTSNMGESEIKSVNKNRKFYESWVAK